LYVSGHLLGKDGRKMSKSLNNGVDPLAAAEKYGVDVLRYVLVREIPFGADGIISDQVIAHRLDNDLANDLGNLASRTLAMIEKYCGGQVPAAHSLSEIDKAIVRTAEELRAQVMSWVDEMKISVAVEAMMNFVRDLNRYVSEKQPWLLFKDTTKKVELGTTLCLLHEGLVCAADLLWPVMPKKMEELRISLGLSPLPGSLEVKWDFNGGAQVAKHPPILFPKAQLLLSEETQS
jgi:methionyl-tRNA synthetase